MRSLSPSVIWRKLNFLNCYESYPTLVNIMFSKYKTILKNDQGWVLNFLKEWLQRPTELGTSSSYTPVVSRIMAFKDDWNLTLRNYKEVRFHGKEFR